MCVAALPPAIGQSDDLDVGNREARPSGLTHLWAWFAGGYYRRRVGMPEKSDVARPLAGLVVEAQQTLVFSHAPDSALAT